MEERRKMSDRRVKAPEQHSPFYHARNIVDRRQKNRSTLKKHWTEYDVGLVTRCLTDNLIS
jgi:hypothetical protein